jgi:hypothetical protein
VVLISSPMRRLELVIAKLACRAGKCAIDYDDGVYINIRSATLLFPF